MNAAIVLLLICLSPATLAHAQSQLPAALLDAAHDRVLQRAFVPSPEQKVGEVRLLQRGDSEVVQTLLYTKILSRVVAEIRQKELANWPQHEPGHADAQRYVELLAGAQKQIWDRLPRDTVSPDRRQKLWIEFVLTKDAQWVALGAFTMDVPDGEVRVIDREVLASFAPSRHYAVRNMRLIAADAFHVGEAALDALLAPFPLLRSGTPK